MIIDFYIPGEPVRTTAQEGHRMSHGHYYTDPKVQAVRQELLEELQPNAPDEPIKSPIHLRVDFHFGTSDIRKQGCWKVTRPDTDNMLKLLKDCMTEAGFWVDDAQVVMEVTSKSWVAEDEACTRIQLYPMQSIGGQ